MSRSRGVGPRNALPTHPAGERGFVYLSAAKFVFLIARLIYFFALPRLLASPAEYGNFTIAIGVMMVASTLFLHGTVQAVSRLTSEHPGEAIEIRTAALWSRLWLCLGLAVLFFAAAPLLAWLFGDPALEPLFEIGGVGSTAYGLFSVFVGWANGTQRFGLQALLDVWASLAKIALVLGLAGWAGTAGWAMGGFVGAQASAALLAIFLLGIRPWRPGFPMRRLLRLEFTLMGFSLLVNLALRADLFLLKALLEPDHAAEQAGYYAAAQIFAQVPFALAASVYLVLLPLVSASWAAGRREEAGRYVRGGFVLAGAIVGWASAVISSNATALIDLVYPSDYAPADGVLEVLVFGGALYNLFFTTATMQTASGLARTATLLGGFYLLVNALIGPPLILHFEMLGSAWMHTIAGAIALAAGLWVVRRRFRTELPFREGFIITLAMTLCWWTPRVLPFGDGGSGALVLTVAVQSAVFGLVLLVGGLRKNADVRELLGHAPGMVEPGDV